MNLFEPLQPHGQLPLGARHALQPGYMLEDFEITQVLGATRFGVLYLARHVVEQHTVAVKEYLPSALATRDPEGRLAVIDPTRAEYFQRGLESFIGQALTLSQFDNPHLLRVTCIWEANGTAYRAMPYLVGSSLLAQRSGHKEPASQAQLQTLLDGLLGAVGELHDAGLAHGQIEPANIFMSEGALPILMDFDAEHRAVVSDLKHPHLDLFADTSRLAQTITSDLHAVAAVLHFAISNRWSPSTPSEYHGFTPLSEVLSQLKDSASALGYSPEFLGAIDTALALAPEDRPGSVAEFRALFEPEVHLPAGAVKRVKAPRRPKRPPPPKRPQNQYPLNSSESVLALLANFDHGPAKTLDDIEAFEIPPVPTLTEEAEPALPPLRASLFDAMDAGEPLPGSSVGYVPTGYRPMPAIPASRWRRVMVPALSFGALVLVCVLAVGWVLST